MTRSQIQYLAIRFMVCGIAIVGCAAGEVGGHGDAAVDDGTVADDAFVDGGATETDDTVGDGDDEGGEGDGAGLDGSLDGDAGMADADGGGNPPRVGPWRVTDAVAPDGGTVYLAIDAVDTSITGIEYKVGDDGPAVALEAVAAGVFTLTGLGSGEQKFFLRLVNRFGASDWSGPQSATPTAQGDQRISVWADGEASRRLAAEPMGAGSTPDMAEGTNRDILLGGGGHAFVVRWAQSPMKLWQAQPNAGDNQGDWLLVDPGGATAAGLAPAAVEKRTLYVDFGAGAEAVTVHVLGAGGMVAYPVMALWGFDGDGDPVPFRFTRQQRGGRLPDGRPFVVGPVHVAHNGGDPVTVAPDAIRGYTVVEDRGAHLVVVSRPGIIPATDAAPAPLNLSHAYVRRRGPYSFAGWDDNAAASAGGEGLLLRPTFETCGVYVISNEATPCQVRFRKKGTAAFYPAQNLFHDPRATGGPPFVIAAHHRGYILYLEPGTTYEVQVKQGSSYWRGYVTTQAFKVPKVSHALGDVDGNLVIRKSGDIVTIDPQGVTLDVSGGKWAEIHSGRVRRGGVSFVGADRIILRNIDVLGAPKHGVQIGTADVRIVGGRISWWGDANSRFWGTKNCGAVRFDPGGDRAAALGLFIGTPRWPSNTWGEYYDETTTHPFGPNAFECGVTHGRTVIDGCSVDSHEIKGFDDGIMQKPGEDGTSGMGPDSIVAWNWLSGMRDDGMEVEDTPSNTIVMHNVIRARNDRKGVQKASGKYTGCVKSFVSIQQVTTGPSVVLRNLFLLANGYAQNETNGFKMQEAEHPLHSSVKAVYHNTIAYEWWLPDPAAPNSSFSSSGMLSITGLKLKNTIAIMQAPGTGNVDTSYAGPPATEIETETYRAYTPAQWTSPKLNEDFTPKADSDLVGAASEMPNLNDGGPWFEAEPSIGALRVNP
jgi:hypothetical protein